MTVRKIFNLVAVAIAVAFLTTGCAKPPDELVVTTTASIDKVYALEPEEYATPSEMNTLAIGLSEAKTEMKVQADKFFFNKDYDKVKVILATTKGKADELVVELPKRKEAAKLLAQDWSVKADASINKAGAIIMIAPKGKGSRADIEAYTEDLEALRIENAETAKLFNTGKYKAAAARFETVATKATFIFDEIDKVVNKKK